MAAKVQIQCINKRDRDNPYERISHVGGKNPSGSPWLLTQQAAVDGILNGTWDFYVRSPRGNEVQVVVADKNTARPYLTTVADGDRQNNLLALVECRLL